MFEDALKHVLAWEGQGLAHNPTEKFRTYSGISEAAQPKWPGWQALDRGATPEAMEGLVRQFYTALWNDVNAGRSGIEQDYFDTCVLQGPRLALRLLVRLHNLLSAETLNPDAPLDVVMFKMDGLNTKIVHERREGIFRALRQSHLIGLAEANPKFEIYLWGWIKRARGDRP